jgi:hypothetical protein
MVPRLLLAFALVVGTAIVTSQAISQEGAPEQPSPEKQAEMMKKWLALNTPGKGHEFLKRFVGKWSTKTRIFMGGPDTPAQESAGTAEFRMILAGRFLQQETKGMMMGMPHEGMGITGFDNFRNRYHGVWAGSMGTNLLVFSGHLDRAGKVQTMYGEMDEPTFEPALVGRTVKYVTRVVDADKFVFEIYDLHAGPDYLVMEITYTRQK